MLKINFVVLLLFVFTNITAQELISENEIRLKSNLNERRESIPIVDSITNKTTLFIVDRKTIYYNLYDDTFTLIDSLSFKRPKTSNKNILEKINTDNDGYLFLLSDNNRKRIELLRVNTKEKSTKLFPLPTLPYTEKYINSFGYKNKICILTINRTNSIIKLHKINAKGEIETLKYIIAEKFYNKRIKPISLYKSIFPMPSLGKKLALDIKLIKTDIPNAIESTSEPIKMYVIDSNVILSIDQGNVSTQLVYLNINSSTYKVKNIIKPSLEDMHNNKFSAKSNSFLSKNKLYQIIGTNDEMRFAITDLTTKNVIKRLAVKKEDGIPFKNSPIIQEGGAYDSYRELEKTQKFLRKISSKKIGIAVKHSKDTIHITMGGAKEVVAGVGFGAMGAAMGTMGTGFGMAASMANNTLYNPTYGAYIAYRGTVSTRIHCIFDQNMSHLKGEYSPNAFDKIKDFSEEIINSQKAETVFKHKDYYVYGYYDPVLHKYYLRKFKD